MPPDERDRLTDVSDTDDAQAKGWRSGSPFDARVFDVVGHIVDIPEQAFACARIWGLGMSGFDRAGSPESASRGAVWPR